MNRDAERAAHHEAGHAVVASTFGRSVVRVSIERDDFTLGRVRRRRRLPRPTGWEEASPRTRRLLNAEIVVAWAGPLAEERFTGCFDEDGARHDLDRSFDLALELAVGDTEEAMAYVEWLRLRTRRLLREGCVSAQVDAVAAALVERRELSGRQVDALMVGVARDASLRR